MMKFGCSVIEYKHKTKYFEMSAYLYKNFVKPVKISEFCKSISYDPCTLMSPQRHQVTHVLHNITGGYQHTLVKQNIDKYSGVRLPINVTAA